MNETYIQESIKFSKTNKFHDYEKIRTVGKGAYGTAVLYKRLSDSREVVLKEVNISELGTTERQMALNEVSVLSVLHHPNIISYLGSFESDGLLVIEMEYANGGTVAQYISRSGGPIPELEILSIFKQIALAINYMHEHNILHRDLKTGNIFLTGDKEVKVGDFGISKVMNTKSAANTVLGTPYYISPEMCEGKEYDEKSDIWALGCILYELACREKTFQGSNLPALVNKIMKGAYEPLPSIYSNGLKLLVGDLLQRDPDLRPPASVILARVVKLYEKLEKKKLLNIHPHSNGSRNIRSVVYQLNGHGASFQLTPFKLPPKIQIQSLAVGSTHLIALSSDQLVFAWGEGKRGQLGVPEPPDWQEEPQLVDNLMSKSINKISAGNGFSVFGTDTGKVLTCGDGTSGSLGHGDWEDVYSPRIIEKLSKLDIDQISCGENHLACLSSEGMIFICGTLITGESICIPQQLMLPKKYKARTISCGPNVTGVVTTNGELLVYGKNESNRLGLNYNFFIHKKDVPLAEELTLVKSLLKWKVKRVSFGRNHTAVVTEDGEVVTMGSKNDSQLGHDSDGPAVARTISDRTAVIAECGPTYTVVGTEDNAIYFWGTRFIQGQEFPRNSQLSMSTVETFASREPEEILVLYSPKRLVSEGIIVMLNNLFSLWHCILIVVDTTSPLGKEKTTQPPLDPNDKDERTEDFDSLGPIPDWIKTEYEKATHEWPGTFTLENPNRSRN